MVFYGVWRHSEVLSWLLSGFERLLLVQRFLAHSVSHEGSSCVLNVLSGPRRF